MSNRTPLAGMMLAALLLMGSAALAQREAAGLWSARYPTFLQEAQRVRQSLASRYGSAWSPASLGSEIAREVSWLEGEAGRLEWDHSRLTARAGSLADETDLMRRKSRLLQLDYEALDRELSLLNAQEAALKEQLAANQRGAVIHNGRGAPKDPAGLSAYNREAEIGNAEGRRILKELADVQASKAQIQERRKPLDDRAAELAARERCLDVTRQNFEADAARFAARCEESIERTRALAVIAGATPANLIRGFRRVYEPKSNAAVAVLQSLGESAAVNVLTKLAVRGAPEVGVALAARDFLAPHIRHGGEDVEDRLLLVGDYAAALKRLQDKPPPGEHDADTQALRAMVERVGQHMPGSKPEFWYQSTELSRLLQDGLSTLAKGYVLQKVLPAGDPLATPLVRSEKESISRLSERLVTTFEAGVKDTAGEKLGDAAWDTLQERTMKDWEEAGRRAAGKKEGSR